MNYTFRKAVRTNTSTLIALAGSSGSGKTYSALRLASGLVGHRGKVVLIDTEAGRALHYADRFDFDHLDLHPPFSPENYAEAIVAAEKAGYGSIIIDSMSHEWAGDGGCQDMHDAAHEKMGGMDATSILAWRGPKTAHKRMISRLLQSRSHLIFCLRAEEKLKFVKNAQGKTVPEPAGWLPICEKNFMYEMTVSFLLMDMRPGVGKPIKLQEQHKPFFNLDSYLDEKAGENLAKWAAGGAVKASVAQTTEPAAVDGLGTDGKGETPSPSSTPSAANPGSQDATPPAYQDYLSKVKLSQSVREVSTVGNEGEADESLTLEEHKLLRAAVAAKMAELQPKAKK